MQYLCLGYLNMNDFDKAPEEERMEILSTCSTHCANLRATGRVVIEEGLQHTSLAKSIRTRNGQTAVTDGPFIETKEQLGGFFIVDAANIDEAVEIASKHPGALVGGEYGFGIEVRPIQ